MERVFSPATVRTNGPLRSRPASPARDLVPGLLLSLAVGAGALMVSRLAPGASPALVAIAVGVVAANTVLRRSRPASVLRPGLAVASRAVLRVGIALLGLELALGDVLALGPATLLVVAAVVGLGMGAGLLAGRLLRLPLAQTALISCGFSICGAAAVAATASALETAGRAAGSGRGDPAAGARSGTSGGGAREEMRGGVQLETQTATAIALVVLFGTLMIPVVALASAAIGLPATGGGTWAGASILEVAQVVAAGSLMGEEVLGTAVLVKLARVLTLAPVIAILTMSLRRAASAPGRPRTGGARPPLVPVFIVAFLVAVGVRSLGIVPGAILDAAGIVQTLLLASAMFALGTGVRADLLRQVGGRPVVLAVILTIVVTIVGLAGALLVS